ncbi:MAG: mandelate racemase/muconate lactonizing enzyme family protein [Vicinamibacteraceae bacterium]
MRITDVQVHPVQAPGRTLVIVTVHTDEGVVGVGEAGLQRRWRAIQGAVEHMKRWLVGEDPFRIERLWQRMWRGGFYPGDRLIGSTTAGIDIALWDIKGKTLGVPVYELLGGRCRDYVEAFTNPGYLTDDAQDREILAGIASAADPDATAEMARRHRARGHKYFRLGIPAQDDRFDARWSVRRCLAQFRAVRDAVGDDLELMVDLHTRLSPDEAIWFCNQAESLSMFVVEDPIRSEYPGGYGRIRSQTRVPLAAGEQWASKWEFREPIENEWIDYARVDICIAGGISEARKIAAIAETHYVKMLPHNPLGPICTAASLHLDLAIDNAGPQEVLFPPDILPEVLRCDFRLEPGRLTVPTTPGLGVTFDADRAKELAAEMTEPPHFHRPDGSFTNY